MKAGVAAMRDGGTVGVLLPGAFYGTARGTAPAGGTAAPLSGAACRCRQRFQSSAKPVLRDLRLAVNMACVRIRT